jgi:hypothetical protein
MFNLQIHPVIHLRKWAISCFLILIYSLKSNGQNPPVNQLKLSLTRMLWMPEPGIELSYQRKTSEGFVYQVTLGRPMNVLGKRYDHMRGYTIAFEPKRFIKRTATTGKYLSLNLRHTDFKFEDITFGKDPSGNTITDSFTIRKNAQALSLRYGKERYVTWFGKPFVLDLSIGAGIRYRNISHSGRTIPYPEKRRESPLDAVDSFEETKGFAFIIPVSFSIGYVF